MINDKMKIIAEQQSQRVVLKGNTIRYNNLLNYNRNTATTNGVTFSISADKTTYTLNGTATADITFFLNQPLELQANNVYILIGCPSGGDDNTYSLRGYYLTSDYGNGSYSKPSTNRTGCYAYIFIKSGTICNNLVFKPMLINTTSLSLTISNIEDFNATDLGMFLLKRNVLPYSPNNTIYNVKSPFTFKGRNLINYKTTYDNTCFELVGNALKNIVVDQRQDDTISFSVYSFAHGLAGSKNMDRNGRIAIELHPTQSGEYNLYHSGSSTNIYITKFHLIGGETYTISLDVISHDSRVVGGFEIANIQLEKGNKATPYLAYDNQLTYTEQIELHGIGTNYDTFSNYDGKVAHKIGGRKIGELTWYYQDGYFYAFAPSIKSFTNIRSIPPVICSDYQTISMNRVLTTLNALGISQDANKIVIKDANYTSVSALVSAKADVYVRYVVANGSVANERSVLVDHRYNKVVDSNGNEIDTE